MELGYWLSGEEHGPADLIELAAGAEEAGFSSAMISDHIQPWTETQGHAPFVWAVLGGIAQRTERLHLATGVTAAIRRMHPVVVAHAAATAAALLPGRFALGLGTGERLNEQVVGRRWPRPGVRRRMLEEGIAIIKPLLAGEEVNFEGRWFRAEHARLYSLPAIPPPVWVAAAGSPQRHARRRPRRRHDRPVRTDSTGRGVRGRRRPRQAKGRSGACLLGGGRGHRPANSQAVGGRIKHCRER